MTIIKSVIRSGAYYDSAFLMQLQRSMAGLPGVQDAGVVMGTESNKEILAHIDLLPAEARAAKPDDLIVVVRANDAAAAEAALGQLEELLTRKKSRIEQEY